MNHEPGDMLCGVADYSIECVDPATNPSWDLFVDSSVDSWLCHTSTWFKVARHVWSHLQPCYVVVREKKKDVIHAGLPLCLVRSLSGRKRLISSPLSTLTGPIGSSEEALCYLFKSLPSVMIDKGASSIEFKTCVESGSIPEGIFSRNNKHCQHEIDLRLSEDDLLKSFNRSNVRNRIRKGQKSRLSLEYADTTVQLKQFYRLYVLNRRRLGLPAIPWSFFEGVWLYLKERDWVKLLMTYYKGELVGGVLYFQYNKRISAEVLAYKTEFITMCPNHLLFWTIIRNARKAGMEKFDFGRTPFSNNSLVVFKDRWGTQRNVLPTFNYPKEKILTGGQENPVVGLIRGAIKHSPLPIFTMASGLFYSRPR